jgi:predicted Zn-dependent protease
LTLSVTDLHQDYERAATLLDGGDPRGAVRAIEPVVAAEPGHAAARQLLALAYFGCARLGRAEEQLRWLIERDPSDHYAHFVMGRTLQRQGQLREALPHLRLAAAMSAQTPYAEALALVERQLGGRHGPPDPIR